MTRARYQQVSLEDTPYYHCISRCVRRAYLCGDDPLTGKNFDHRKRWLVERIKQLASYYAIDICAYAVMSNHYHLVLHVDQDSAAQWSDEEVIRRWAAVFPGNGKLIETLRKNARSKAARKKLAQQIELWRQRLCDISWYMRCLNESVARRANREDECSGRFWEGRFKSQALLDEKALVTCMAYVDLNPVRAGISDSLDASDFTSIQERLIVHAKKVKKRSYRQHRLLTRRSAKHLVGQSAIRQVQLKSLNQLPDLQQQTLPITQQAYFELLESTCKALSFSEPKQERALQLLDEQASTLGEFGISSVAWLKAVQEFHRYYGNAAGTEDSLLRFQQQRIKAGVDFKHARKWIRGTGAARLLYAS